MVLFYIRDSRIANAKTHLIHNDRLTADQPRGSIGSSVSPLALDSHAPIVCLISGGTKTKRAQVVWDNGRSKYFGLDFRYELGL